MNIHSQPQLSVVVPLFEEAHRIGKTLLLLADELDALGICSEVILVVEPGEDDTAVIASSLASANGWHVLLANKHLGKGGAVRAGMLSASGDIICFMDADMSTDLGALSRALALFGKKPELAVIVADRQHRDSEVPHKQNFRRRVLSRSFNALVRLLFPVIQLRDTQCGFKLFRASAASAIFARQRLNGFAFDVEVLVLASALRLPVEPLPVVWMDAPRSAVRLLRHGLGMVLDVLALRVSTSRADWLQKCDGLQPE